MKVKYLKGDNQQYNPIYDIVMPVNTEIEDLPNVIQDSIKVLGELEIRHTEDLSDKNDDWSLTIKEQIQEMGASLRRSCYISGTWPPGLSYTFPPFSELDELKHNKDKSNTESDIK